jgi:hypothetical protein
MDLIINQRKMDQPNARYVEIAPESWIDECRFMVTFRCHRFRLADLTPVCKDVTIPTWLETDGACSGKPRSGRWRYVHYSLRFKGSHH